MKKKSGDLLVFEWEKMPYVRAIQGTALKHGFPRHMHDSYSIGIIDKGSRMIAVHGTSHVVSARQMFVINPNESHQCESCGDDGHSYRVVCIMPEYFARCACFISNGTCDSPLFPNLLVMDSVLPELLETFFDSFGKACRPAECEHHLQLLVSELIVRHAMEPPKEEGGDLLHGAVDRVCDYIRENFCENITMAQLASEACLSPFYLQRRFLGIKGVSPYEYLVKCRIDRAMELLRGSSTISAVAAEVGFADQSHFTRFFKRSVGVTPGRFAALNR